jgi:hypothetical protein
MSLSQLVRKQLESWSPMSGDSRVLAAQGGNAQCVTCELTSLEKLGCSFTHITVQDPRLLQADVDRLSEVGDRLAGRLNYLLEPICPIEVDADQCVVQLRSSPPHRDEDVSSYYELLANRQGEISLRRFVKTPGDPRRNVAATITLEVLYRLIDDMASAAD